MIGRLSVAAAFSTLCFLNTWVELAQGRGVYFARFDPLHAVVLPVLCWQLLIAAVVFFLPPRALLVASVVPLGFSALAILRMLPFEIASVVLRPWFWPLVVFALAAAAMIWLRIRDRLLLPSAEEVYLYTLPVLLWIVFQAAWHQFPSAQYQDRPNQAQRKAVSNTTPRVIWIIFDEMSQEAVFDKRPTGIQMPNFDRLRAQGLYATNVLPPAPNTLESLPSLLTGRKVKHAIPKGPRELELRFEDGTTGNWSEMEMIFDRVPVRSGLAGWFHPYCRVLPADATSDCAWTAGALLTGIEEPSEEQSLMEAMRDRFGYQVRAFPLLGRIPGFSPLEAANREKQRRLDWLIARSLKMAVDAELGLLVLHYPVPHPPGGYIANLERADAILGRLTEEVAKAGLENRTAFIVSSDHGWRPGIWSHTADWSREEHRLAESIGGSLRIPFLVRVPGSSFAGTVFEPEWNSVRTGALVRKILAGQVHTLNDLNW